MVTRRNFLGGVIGLVGAGFSIEFLARLPQEPTQRIILPYRMLFKDSISGYTIQAPGVKEIIKENRGFRFIAEDLCITTHRPIRIDRVILFTEQGHLIRETRFDSPVQLGYKDTLRVQQHLIPNREIDSIEEFTKYFIREQNNERKRNQNNSGSRNQ